MTTETELCSGNISNDNGTGIPYRLTLLDTGDMDQVVALQDAIVEEINDPVFYDPVIEENIYKRFSREGRIIGAFADDQLVGCHIVHLPAPDDDNFGRDLGLPETELPKVAHLAAIMVLDKYRENNFAYMMNIQAIKLVSTLGYHHLCSTVFPANTANIAALFKTGLTIRMLKEKYGGKLRYIFYKDHNAAEIVTAEQGIQMVLSDDIPAQYRLLEDGYIGTACTVSGNQTLISYARIIAP